MAGLLAAALSVAFILEISHDYRDEATQWTVIGATLTAGGVLLALVGLPAAIYQLAVVQVEQDRIARELVARPILQVGFSAADDDPRIEDDLDWPSPRLDFLKFCAVNSGERSARGLRLQVMFPPEVTNLSIGGPTSERDKSSCDQQSDASFRVTTREAIPNPGERSEITCRITVAPTASAMLLLRCRWFSEDAAPGAKTLRLHTRR